MIAYVKTQVENQKLDQSSMTSILKIMAYYDELIKNMYDKKDSVEEIERKRNLAYETCIFFMDKYIQKELSEKEFFMLISEALPFFIGLMMKIYSGELTKEEYYFAFKNPLEYYLQLFDKNDFSDEVGIIHFLKTRGVTLPDDELLALFNENDNNLTLALYSWHSTHNAQNLNDMVVQIMDVLQQNEIYETRENVLLRLFGDMNTDTVIRYFLKLKTDMDRAVQLLPTCLANNPHNYSVDTILCIIADADHDPAKIKDIMAGNPTSEPIFLYNGKLVTDVVNVAQLPTPEWRFIHATIEDKQCMDWMSCLCLNTYCHLVVKSHKDIYLTKLPTDKELLTNIHLDVLNLDLVDKLLDKLNGYAMEGNKLCVLALIPQLFVKIRPLKLCATIFKSSDDDFDLFHTKYMSEVFTEKTFTILPQYDNFEDFLLLQVHPDNRKGYHAVDERLILFPNGGQLLYYNSQKPIITKQKWIATRGGTHKKVTKNKTVRLR